MRNIKHFKMIVSLLLVFAMAITFIPAVNAPAYAASGPVITTDKTEYKIGEEVLVTTKINDASGGWIALYPAEVKEYNMSIYWYYPQAFPETRPMIGGPDINVNNENWGTGNPTEGIPEGKYQIVYAYGSSYPYDIQGSPAYFEVLPSAPDQNTMRTDKTTYNYSDPIKVTASCESAGSWVGLYASNETPGSDLAPIYRHDVTDTEPFDLKSGTAGRELGIGSYKVYLFGDSGYDNILYTITINVNEDPQPADELSLSFVDPEKTTYKLGEPVNIRVTGTDQGAWVGLYNIDDKTDPNNGGVTSLRWFWVYLHNGEKIDITDPVFDDNGKGGLREGQYKIVLFGDSGYNDERTTLEFKMEGMIDVDVDSFSLEPSKTDFVSGEDIMVTAKGVGTDDNAWVALYPADTTSYGKNYLYKYRVKDNEGKEVAMQKQEKGSAAGSRVPDGFYELVLFANSGYNLPVLKKNISVTKASTSIKRLRDPGCVTLGLEYIVYVDGTDTYRQIPTLGGHIWGDPEHVEGTAKHVYTCSRDADHKKTEACRKTNEKLIKAAEVGVEGSVEYTCDRCGGTFTETIPAIKAPTLSGYKFEYSGDDVKPELSAIVDVKGNEIDESQYTVSYPEASKAVGTYRVKIEFTGKYSGTIRLNYDVVPMATTLKKVTAKSKSFKATWRKGGSEAKGYQIAYSRKKDFSSYSTKRVKKLKTTSLTVKKLKKGKTYYVKVRTYKLVGGKYYYSDWSNVKTVKPKK